MHHLLGALALTLAVPAAAQTAPAADPHAGHSQHQGHAAAKGMDHAQMMAKCKDPKASAEMKAHCAKMMKEHGEHAPASPQPKADHGGHSH